MDLCRIGNLVRRERMRTNRRKFLKMFVALKYIERRENNTEAYIDTLIYDGEDISYRIISDVRSTGYILGFSAKNRLLVRDNSAYYTVNGNWQVHNYPITFNKDKVYDLTISAGVLTDNLTGLSVGNRTVNINNSHSMELYNKLDTGTGKVYRLTIFNKGKPIRDFIPAKRHDGEVGMYDLVGRKFYTSPNGVAFTGG